MPRAKPWLKMWVSWVDDPQYLRLTMAEQTAYWRVYALAHRCNAGGFLITDSGSPLSMEEIATTLHIVSSQDTKALKSMLEKMDKEREIFIKDGALFITRYEEEQALRPSDTKEAMADRQRRRRERLDQERDMSQEIRDKETVTENPLPSEQKKAEGAVSPPHPLEGEGEGEGECHDEKLVTCHGNSVTAEAALAEISKLHEEIFGIITPILSEKFKDFVENYRGPVEWIKEAFAEAVEYGNRRWQYVEAILYSWQEKGGPHADREERGAGERARAPADRRDPLAVTRQRGWKVKRSGPTPSS